MHVAGVDLGVAAMQADKTAVTVLLFMDASRPRDNQVFKICWGVATPCRGEVRDDTQG